MHSSRIHVVGPDDGQMYGRDEVFFNGIKFFLMDFGGYNSICYGQYG